LAIIPAPVNPYPARFDRAGSTYLPGQPGNEFKPEVQPLPGETVVAVHNAFIGTDLERSLRDAGSHTVAAVGVITNNSVEATVRMGSNLGFDICSSRTPVLRLRGDYRGVLRSAEEVHAMSLANLDGEYCRVVRTAEVLAAVV
jgi:isochorismate hydrolase